MSDHNSQCAPLLGSIDNCGRWASKAEQIILDSHNRRPTIRRHEGIGAAWIVPAQCLVARHLKWDNRVLKEAPIPSCLTALWRLLRLSRTRREALIRASSSDAKIPGDCQVDSVLVLRPDARPVGAGTSFQAFSFPIFLPPKRRV